MLHNLHKHDADGLIEGRNRIAIGLFSFAQLPLSNFLP